MQYITVADGLKPGKHELTVIPEGKGSFTIQAVDVFDPPLKP